MDGVKFINDKTGRLSYLQIQDAHKNQPHKIDIYLQYNHPHIHNLSYFHPN